MVTRVVVRSSTLLTQLQSAYQNPSKRLGPRKMSILSNPGPCPGSAPQATPFRLQILSDLHLEGNQLGSHYSSYSFPVKAPALALLGDIGKATDSELFTFLIEQCWRYDSVFYLLGNHEAYESSYSAAASKFRQLENEIERQRHVVRRPAADHCFSSQQSSGTRPAPGKFVFLDRTRFDVPGTNLSILGCTLFSDIRPEQRDSVAFTCNDFVGPYGDKAIPGWTTGMHNASHAKDLAWLNSEVSKIEAAEPDRHVMILSHHSPSVDRQANDPMHLQDARNIHSAFTTDLSRQLCWTSRAVKVWAFGHTHYNCDFVVRENGKAMRVITNQKGYFTREKGDFDAQKVVEVSGAMSGT